MGKYNVVSSLGQITEDWKAQSPGPCYHRQQCQVIHYLCTICIQHWGPCCPDLIDGWAATSEPIVTVSLEDGLCPDGSGLLRNEPSLERQRLLHSAPGSAVGSLCDLGQVSFSSYKVEIVTRTPGELTENNKLVCIQCFAHAKSTEVVRETVHRFWDLYCKTLECPFAHSLKVLDIFYRVLNI